MRSFRSALALRVTAQALALATALVVGAAFLLRSNLVSSVDSSLIQIAQIQAETAPDSSGSGAVEPHLLLPGKQTARGDEPTWTQLLSADGTPLSRSGNLPTALPVPPRALETARRGTIARATVTWGGVDIRTVLFPLSRLGQRPGGAILQVAMSLEPTRQTLLTFVRRLAALGLAGTAFAWLVAWQTARRALTPALAITAQAESIGVGELDRRVSAPGDLLEFNRMAIAFNALLDRIEHAVTGTRRFTSDASHELRAPLTVLRGELELALSRPRTLPDYEEVLRRCLDEVLRLVRLADDLLTLTRVEGGVVGGKRIPVDLDELTARVIGRKQTLADRRGVTLDLSGTAGLVSGDADLLLRAVDCLLEHAIMASPPGGAVSIRLEDRHVSASGRGSGPGIIVTDSGPGLRQDEVSGVFQRFYRSNRPRAGSEESGLGLPIARAVAVSHGGGLDYVGNDPGASFRLYFPPVKG